MFPLSFAAAALCDEWTTTLTTLTTTTMESIEATLWRRSSSADEDLSPNDDDDDDDDGKKGGIAYRPLVEALKPNGTLRVRVLFDEKDDDEKKNNAARNGRCGRARAQNGRHRGRASHHPKKGLRRHGANDVFCDRDETGVGTRREVSTEQEEKEQQR